jgi:hypothetical protein
MYYTPEAIKQFRIAAARRAMSLVNTLKPGPFKAAHASRVFRNYNQMRRV